MIGDHSPIEAEQLFVGSLLVDPSRLKEVEISADYLTINMCREAFSIMLEMERDSELIDVFSVSERMPKSTSGSWSLTLTIWAQDAFTESFFKTSQSSIIKRRRMQEIKKIAHTLTQDFNADSAIQSLMDLNTVKKNYTHTMIEALQSAVAYIQTAAESDGVVGLTTGLKKLDDAISGFQAPDLYVIGARPAMGKTAVVINFMLANKCAAGFFSTEQPMQQIGVRSLSIDGGVSARNLRTAKLEQHEHSALVQTIQKNKDSKIFIHDKANITIVELMREARQMKFNHDIKIIYVDYIQRIKGDKAENRRLEVAEVVSGLKTLARELEIPVVALAQVNREVDKRPDKRPRMGDLLESGVIEQEADAVMMLYRDEVYNEGTSTPGIMEILIDKNRHGPTGKLSFAWLGDKMKIGDLSYEAY